MERLIRLTILPPPLRVLLVALVLTVGVGVAKATDPPERGGVPALAVLATPGAVEPDCSCSTSAGTAEGATPVVDSDGDGLTDHEEASVFGTDPNSVDTDGDGLSDAAELLGSGTNPLLVDTDGDGLDDAIEVHGFGTNPSQADTDGDGLSDGAEVGQGTDPLNPASG